MQQFATTRSENQNRMVDLHHHPSVRGPYEAVNVFYELTRHPKTILEQLCRDVPRNVRKAEEACSLACRCLLTAQFPGKGIMANLKAAYAEMTAMKKRGRARVLQ